MSDLPPRDRTETRQAPALTPARIAIWIVVGAIGVFLLASGIVGILVKG